MYDMTNLCHDKRVFYTIRSLQSNNDFLINKPDKSAGFVILKKHDYVSKMDTLLHDAFKFKNIGPVSQNDDPVKIEYQNQRRLLKLKKKNLIPVGIYKAIGPTDS